MKNILFGFILLATFCTAAYAQPQTAHPLAQYLNPDGTLNIPPGFSGSFNVKGWKMHTASNGAPRFTQETTSILADTAWDVNFLSGDSHINGDVRALAVIGNNVYIGGAFTNAANGSVNHIVGWNETGWFSLGSGVNSIVYAMAVIGTDLYVGGDFSSPSNCIAKWNGGGWSTLGTGTDGTVFALATDGTNLYVGGVFGSANGVGASRIAKWNGTSWSALGTGMSATVAALAVSGSNLYAGGYFATAGGVTVNQIARWNGSNWDSLGAGVDGNISAIAVNGSDVYVGGSFSMAGSVSANYIARWDGTKWDSLGPGVNNTVYSLVVNGSDIIAGGASGLAGGSPGNEIAKWDGSHWSALGGGMNYTVRALALDGYYLVAGGLFTTAGVDSATRVARWDGNSWSTLGTGINGFINAVAVSGSNVYVGGYFTAAGGVAANNIAKWDGTRWFALGSGIAPSYYIGFPVFQYFVGYVSCLLVDGSNVYAGGQFDTAGSAHVTSIAKWNGSVWSGLGSGLVESNSPRFPAIVQTIALNGTDIIAGGNFINTGPNLARWNGSAWSAVGGNVNGSVASLASSGTDLYAGGAFDSAGGVRVNHIAKWDGSSWSALGVGTDSAVAALTVNGSNVYAAGTFIHAGGIPAKGFARWNGSSWSVFPSGVSGSYFCVNCTPQHIGPVVSALAASGLDVYAGGTFDTAGSIVANGLARWDGFGWSTLGSGLTNVPPSSSLPTGFPAEVSSFALGSGYLYVAGGFPTAGGKPAYGLARWRIPPPSKTFDLESGWNLISLPLAPSNDSVNVLFPGASSKAFGYSGGYYINATMNPGNGYWIKYPSSTSITMDGTVISSDTISVTTGWNLIGSISLAIPVSSITSNPPGMVTGNVFGYNGNYQIADSIFPGSGYWIKVTGSGQLILSSSGIAAPKNRIKIIPTSEFPPSPPDNSNIGHRTSNIPLTFSLEQNYPNPFNPLTVIRYSLPLQSRVSLKIYNVLGQEVKTLVNEVQAAGFKSVSWDAGEIPSGMYFYRLVTERFSQTRKLALVK